MDAGEARLLQALDEAEGHDSLRGTILDQLGWARGMIRGDLRGGVPYSREAALIAERIGDAELQMLSGARAIMNSLAGARQPERFAWAVKLEAELGKPSQWDSPRALQGEDLLWAGDLSAAKELFDAVYADAASLGRGGPPSLLPLRPRLGRVRRREPEAGAGARARGDRRRARRGGHLGREPAAPPAGAGAGLARPERGGPRQHRPPARGIRAVADTVRESPELGAAFGLLSLSRRGRGGGGPRARRSRRACSTRWGLRIRERSPRSRMRSRRSPSPATRRGPGTCSRVSRSRRPRSNHPGRGRPSTVAVGFSCCRRDRRTRPASRSNGRRRARSARIPAGCRPSRTGLGTRGPAWRWTHGRNDDPRPMLAIVSRRWAPRCGRSRRLRSSSAPRPAARQRGDRHRAPDRGSGRRGDEEPADRRGALHRRRDGRGPPHAHLPKAGHPVARPTSRVSSPTGAWRSNVPRTTDEPPGRPPVVRLSLGRPLPRIATMSGESATPVDSPGLVGRSERDRQGERLRRRTRERAACARHPRRARHRKDRTLAHRDRPMSRGRMPAF